MLAVLETSIGQCLMFAQNMHMFSQCRHCSEMDGASCGVTQFHCKCNIGVMVWISSVGQRLQFLDHGQAGDWGSGA